jgi:hypothetical protein
MTAVKAKEKEMKEEKEAERQVCDHCSAAPPQHHYAIVC